ncbi:MAG: hypothetical protein IKH15_05795 [Bacteroidales bacterium]|nr:hypothetical protein [Bacteroidales bacterium]MBR4637623.1 hypothetical protein [Bacteroidales bacterium]MBR6174459.1 hypothetical protein [Bacteroidales bacterium]MBR6905305.1 hypothetical protein [Bacteroidales bacterium]
MRRFCVILLVLLSCFAAYAQREQIGEAVTFHDTTWYDRGFDVYIGGGMFWGGRQTALYYNGSRYNECNLNYIFDNEYRVRELLEAVVKVYPHISMSDQIGYNESDLNMLPNYTVSASVGVGVRYKIRNNWGISLSYMFSRLTTTNKLLLTYTSISGNLYDAPELTLVGKEDRSMIDLSVSYLFSGVHPIVKPFVEVGAQFNYAKVKKFDAILLDKRNNPVYTQTLMDIYNGGNYVPGVDMQTYDVIYGGPGFGASFSAGLKIVVNKFVSIDPTFYFCASRLHLEPYGNKVMSLNYGAMVRVVMNDFFFQNR